MPKRVYDFFSCIFFLNFAGSSQIATNLGFGLAMQKLLFTSRCVLFSTLFGATSCSLMHDSMRAMKHNKWEIEMSTYTIDQNTHAIEAVNGGIEENTKQLEEVNNILKKVSES
jgi:hypothetical protein